MSDDILTRIDDTLTDTSACFCGCRRPIAAAGASPWFASEECQVRWNVRRITSKDSSDEVSEPAEAAAEPPAARFRVDWSCFNAPMTHLPIDVQRRVQDGTAPAPDPIGDAMRAEVLRQGLTECEIDGVRWVHVEGEWMTAPATGGPPGSWFDETRRFRRAYLNERIESLRQGRVPFLSAALDAEREVFTERVEAALDELLERPAAPRFPWWHWKRWTR